MTRHLSGVGWLSLLFLVLATVLLLVLVWMAELEWMEVVEGATLSIFAASLTAVIVDALTHSLERRRWFETRIKELASSDHGFSSRSLELLRDRGMIHDGSLDSQDLRGANLSHLDLQGAKLREAQLDRAILRGADLRDANLDGASLRGANLEQAMLSRASLDDCDFREANLDEAEMDHTSHERASFENASMKGTNWTGSTPPQVPG